MNIMGSTNIFYQLRNNEYGNQTSSSHLNHHYMCENIRQKILKDHQKIPAERNQEFFIGSQGDDIKRFDVDVCNRRIATFSTRYLTKSKVELWDLDTGKCKRSFEVDSQHPPGILKIVNDHIICSTAEKTYETGMIYIFDLANEEQTSPTVLMDGDYQCDDVYGEQVCVVGNEIFAVTKSEIKVWDIDGKPRGAIKSLNYEGRFQLPAHLRPYIKPYLLHSNGKLVHIFGNKVRVFDLKARKGWVQTLKNYVTAVYVDELKQRLYCGNFESPSAQEVLACRTINLIDGSTIRYCTKLGREMYSEAQIVRLRNNKSKQYPFVSSILANNGRVFIGHSTGQVLCCHIDETSTEQEEYFTDEFELGKHTHAVKQLSLDNNVLVSSSSVLEDREYGCIKFWDNTKLKKKPEALPGAREPAKIGEMAFPHSLGQLSLTGGDLILETEGKLKRFNFLSPPHKSFSGDGQNRRWE